MTQENSGFETPAEGKQGDGASAPSPETASTGAGNASPATAAAQSAYGTAKAHAAAAAGHGQPGQSTGNGAEGQKPTEASQPADGQTPGDGEQSPSGEPAPGQGHEALEQDVQELMAKAEKADEYLALAQRLQADFENYRKRASRDAALAQERGVAKLAKELLPAIDNLDRAVHHLTVAGISGAEGDTPAETPSAEAEDAQLVSGVKLVHAEVVAALGRAGIESFAQAGEPFDPQHHEAVAQHHVEGAPAGTVLEVYQQGYKLGETILRPARVLVSA